jgi:hypothetical protein
MECVAAVKLRPISRKAKVDLQNQFISARLQRQTLASTTGAAIIENGKITKPCPKNEC